MKDHAPFSPLKTLSLQMRKLHDQPGLGARCLGVPSFDAQLYQIGQEWLAAHAEEVGQASDAERKCDVYLATQLYPFGGHTPLIGDFVEALGNTVESHLIVTNVLQLNVSPLPENTQSRTRIGADKTTFLTSASFEERLDELLRILLTLRPRRLFLFQHPHDPVAVAACQPWIASQRVLVHHADSIPSFGLFLPGVQIIDLNPTASSVTRFLGLKSNLLLLTSPDPGPRPVGFLTRGNLVTATCGGPAKYQRLHAHSYAEIVAVILRSTGGWHYHVGQLGGKMLGEIARVLARENISADRFIHVEWTPSLSAFLWEQACDVYFSSFPVNGARTNAEVLASATPHLRYSERPERALMGCGSEIPGGLTWSTPENLTSVLREVGNRETLEKLSREMRLAYDKTHHPRVFAGTLENILAGKNPPEEMELERDKRALQLLLKTVIHTQQTAWLAPDVAAEKLDTTHIRLTETLHKQRERIDFLQEQRKRLEQKLTKLESENERRGKGRSLRARLWRWLTRV
ncbi:MAG: hypothetical protein ABIT76_04885 [Chthoniobacterales bacterium]